jgi:hypothetical protein
MVFDGSCKENAPYVHPIPEVCRGKKLGMVMEFMVKIRMRISRRFIDNMQCF